MPFILQNHRPRWLLWVACALLIAPLLNMVLQLFVTTKETTENEHWNEREWESTDASFQDPPSGGSVQSSNEEESHHHHHLSTEFLQNILQEHQERQKVQQHISIGVAIVCLCLPLVLAASLRCWQTLAPPIWIHTYWPSLASRCRPSRRVSSKKSLLSRDFTMTLSTEDTTTNPTFPSNNWRIPVPGMSRVVACGGRANGHHSEDSWRCIESAVCTICLASYQCGDKIAWSQNPNCVHHFHKKCLTSWLRISQKKKKKEQQQQQQIMSRPTMISHPQTTPQDFNGVVCPICRQGFHHRNESINAS